VSSVLIPQLSVNRAQVAVASNRGVLYFAGGYTPGNAQTTRVDLFTFTFGSTPVTTVPQFVILTADLPAGRHGGVALPYSNDRIAVVGGYRAFSPSTVDYVKNDGTTGTLGVLQAGFPEGPASACVLADSMFMVAPTTVQQLQFFANGVAWVVALPAATLYTYPITNMVSYLVDEQSANYNYAYTYIAKVVFLVNRQMYIWVVPPTLYSLTYPNSVSALVDADLQLMGAIPYTTSDTVPTMFLVGRRAVVIGETYSSDPLMMLSFDTSNYAVYAPASASMLSVSWLAVAATLVLAFSR